VANIEYEGLLAETVSRFWETIPPVWHSVRDNVRGFASDDYGLTVEQFYVLRHIRRGIRTCERVGIRPQDQQFSHQSIGGGVGRKG
jgi:hypothetical protein